jgi:H/ACA ribonucleoprotein complex non-core subunit NAF1
MDSPMDIEKSGASESATKSLPSEDIQQSDKVEQASIQTSELSHPVSNDADSHDLMVDDPPLTSALEALLGGLDPVAPLIEELPISNEPSIDATKTSNPAMIEPVPQDTPTSTGLPLTSEDSAMIDDGTVAPVIPGLLLATNSDELNVERIHDMGPEVTSIDSENHAVQESTVEEAEQDEHPEWEIDSSPIESSSDDSSSDDSSSDESEEGESAYKLLSPEEQARILMRDGGSDDEGDGKAKGSGTHLRTKNEVPEVVIPKPDVTITESMPICELGVVEGIVENILLIKANTSGEYRVLESGSVLCLPNRSVIGAVSETLGRVQQPLYSVLFTNSEEVKEAGLEVGTKIFYSEQHSTYVFTQALKAFKGSDASNLHDEEVGDEEMEFSDDEAEAEHKRKVKQKKMERRGGMQQNGNSSRGGHPLQQQHTPYDNKGLTYEDNDDGPYKPLARPAGYVSTLGQTEAPQEAGYQGIHDRPRSKDHLQFRGRGRGDRGDRGRGRGGDRGRGRGRGGFQDRRGDSNGYSLPPQDLRNQPSPQSPGTFQQPNFPSYQQPGYAPPHMPQNFFPPQQYSPQQPQMSPWQGMVQQPPQSSWPPNMPPPPPLPGLPGGAFINPAFFGQQQAYQNQWNQQQKK